MLGTCPLLAPAPVGIQGDSGVEMNPVYEDVFSRLYTLGSGLSSLTVNDSWKKFCFPSTPAYLWTRQLGDTLLQGKGMGFRGPNLVAPSSVIFMSLSLCLSLFCLAGLFRRWTEIMSMKFSSRGRLDPWFGVKRTNSVTPSHWQWTFGQMMLAVRAKVSFCIKWIW